MTGYNPNRDSGIAEPRSYVEIGKDSLQGLVEEYDCVPVATQRYFAQLVYNVGPGGGGGGSSDFTPSEIAALKELVQQKDALIGIATQAIQTIDVSTTELGNSVGLIGKIIPVKFVNNQYTYNTGTVIDDNNDDLPEYLINIPGYACGIACYVWIDETDPNSGISNTMERLYPKLLYTPPTELSTIGIPISEFSSEDKDNIQKYGITQIFLNFENEYKVIKELPDGKNTIRISFIQIPAKK